MDHSVRSEIVTSLEVLGSYKIDLDLAVKVG